MIRAAVLTDMPALVALGQRFLASSVYAQHFRENPAQMQVIAERLISQDDGIVLVSVTNDGLNGAIGLLLFPQTWTGDLTCGECFFFVDTAWRGSLGVRLFKAAEAWALDHGAGSIQMVAPEGAHRVELLYKAAGYVPLERGWVRRL